MVSKQKVGFYCIWSIEAIEKIQSICDDDKECFIDKKNRVQQSACIMQLINLIEIIKKVTIIYPDIRKQWETQKMNGLRNIAAHDYMAIDMYIIHDVIKNYLPGLLKNIKNLHQKDGGPQGDLLTNM